MIELLTPKEAAARLRCSVKTLRAHVRSGALGYIVTGRGKKRPGIAFDPSDLEAFTLRQRRMEAPCQSGETRVRATGNSTSSFEVIAFTARQRPQLGVKPKQ